MALSTGSRKRAAQDCKVFPGDASWPTDETWGRLNASLDGALRRPKPAGAVCYPGPDYDAARCQFLVSGASATRFWLDDPLTELAQWTQGSTCVATLTPAGGNCTRGGFPEYVVNATTVKHVQIAVNFARNSGIRLVIKNTGHDFGGRSVGAGALSIWTHWLKASAFLPAYRGGGDHYRGAAARLGAGVEAWEVSNLMAAHGVAIVAAGCNTVGGSGGWLSGGGHTTVSSALGLGADQALAFGVVAADGRFVTADAREHADLFWALRGGGGGTYGIVTSVTVKAHPPVTLTSVSLSLSLVPNTSTTTSSDPSSTGNATAFWAGVGAYLDFARGLLAAGGYGFGYIRPTAPGASGYTLSMTSTLVNATAASARAFFAPLDAALRAAGFPDLAPAAPGAPRPYAAPRGGTGGDRPADTRYRSRLVPGDTDTAAAVVAAAVRAALRGAYEEDYYFHGTLTAPPPPRDVPPGAVHPAWRANLVHAMLMETAAATSAGAARARDAAMAARLAPLAAVAGGAAGGGYINEGDPGEADWRQVFFGANYAGLLRVKRKWDPEGVFWAPTTVGSEGWAVRAVDGYPNSQNGRLCRVGGR
ncbi:hypothetical protein F4780DRAFT_786875 [Xylariomycetidae sp. FL0641]|nr:hypothetical protein F4780DRAFT_786875 [Xylariomycetidae sp. FL0641]